MNFMDAVKTCFNKYIDFSGRAPRSEFWWFMLFLMIASAVLGQIDTALFGPTFVMTDNGFEYNMGILGSLFSLATLLPSIAVTARRLHDIDKSGWWQLIAIIPLIGWIIMLVWMIKKGTPGDNRFGPDPLA